MRDFNLRRDARPLATPRISGFSISCVSISISDEMPGPWRQGSSCLHEPSAVISISDEMPGPWRLIFDILSRAFTGYFNLIRVARPLATDKKHKIWYGVYRDLN